MRSRYRICKLCGELHEVRAWPDNHRELPPQRSALPAAMVIRDNIDDLWHPSDGNYYDSKAKFREITKAHDGIEVGNDIQRDTRYVNTVSEAEVAKAYQMVEQGYKPRPDTATADEMGSIV